MALVGKWVALACVAIVLPGLAFWLGWRLHTGLIPGDTTTTAAANNTPNVPGGGKAVPSAGATNVYAHNLMLRKGPSFRVYVRWLRGQMAPAKKNEVPSFDDPDSFFLNIQDGVLRANIGDISNYLNSGGLGDSPLKNVTLRGDGTQVTVTATLHKLVDLPVKITGEISIVPDNRVRLHVQKIDVLKLPLKWLLNSFRVTVADLAGSNHISGLTIAGNDLIFDTGVLLPPPHIRGNLTMVHVVNPDLEEIYGDAQADVARTEQWRNFIHLQGGSLDFGKLTMHGVDLMMIDISSDPWFDLDLTNYQAQLVNGYTHMTPQAGLQIFMPDLRTIPANQQTKDIGLEWMKNRYAPVPASVTRH